MSIDDGKELGRIKRKKNGPEMDKSIDARSDAEDRDKTRDDRTDTRVCEVCFKTFKKRGIKIHQTKSGCRRILQMSRRLQLPSPPRTVPNKEHNKTSDDLPPEAPHSGRAIHHQGRRTPFIVSQTFHSRRLKKDTQGKDGNFNDRRE